MRTAMMRGALAGALLLGACGASVQAQSNIQPANKYVWAENIGFINCRDANAGAQGVVVRYRRLSGYAWSENCGWINFGDGSPTTLPYYSNTTGADHGVNVQPNGDCFGLAWGENVGWINFDTLAALGGSGQQARVDRPAGRLRGYAWGENIGWINLDNAIVYAGYDSVCIADYNSDGVVDLLDLLAFVSDWNMALGGPALPSDPWNIDGNDTIDLLDLLGFVGEWNAQLGTEC